MPSYKWRNADGSETSDTSVTIIENITIVYVTDEVTEDVTAENETTSYLVDASGGDIEITLPDPLLGVQFYFKKVDHTSNKVILVGDIDDEDEAWLTHRYDAIQVISGSSGWNIV